jgi:hypothetical protein
MASKHQMVIKYAEICIPIKGLQKYTEIGILFENIPTGNPAAIRSRNVSVWNSLEL